MPTDLNYSYAISWKILMSIGALLCSPFLHAQFFGPQQDLVNVNPYPDNITAGDIDGDGDQDFLVSNRYGNRLSWFEYDPTIADMYNDRSIIELPSPAGLIRDIELHDIDLDGDLDILISHDGPNASGTQERRIHLFCNTGDGQFSTAEWIQSSSDIMHDMALADLDDDGDLDLVFAETIPLLGSRVKYRLNDGSGGFGGAFTLGTSSDVRSIQIADVDDNGLLDVVAASGSPGEVRWFSQTSGMIFNSGQVLIQSFLEIVEIRMEDVNADGLPDIFLMGKPFDNAIHSLTWYENIGSGFFSSLMSLSIGAPTYAFSLVDIDGDGHTDVVQSVDEGVQWRENKFGQITFDLFGPLQSLFAAPNRIISIAPTDLDDDGDTDFIYSIGDYSNELTVAREAGESDYSQQITVDSPSIVNPTNVQTADLDGDGDEDIVFGSSEEETIQWRRNLGNGQFGMAMSAVDLTTSVYWNASDEFGSTDIDGDGDVDILLSLSSIVFQDPTIGIYWAENDGNGSFSEPHALVESGTFISNLYMMDIDADGDEDVIDVVIDGLGGGILETYEKIGDAEFIYKELIFDFYPAVFNKLDFFDANGDGQLDVFLTLDYGNSYFMLLFENSGDGSFESFQVIDGYLPAAVMGLSHYDFDSDGDQDIYLTIDAPMDNVIRYTNDGTGYFGPGLTSPGVPILSLEDPRDIQFINLDAQGGGQVCIAGGSAIQLFQITVFGDFVEIQNFDEHPEEVSDLHTADLDGDGDPDLLACGFLDDRVAWYENLTFDPVNCPEDITGDGIVDVEDFIAMNSSFGISCVDCPEDINNDSEVDILDFIQLNSKYGESCD